MAVCAWALDESEAPLHAVRRNREHALGRQFSALLGGRGSYTSERFHFDAEDGSRNVCDFWISSDPASWVTRAFCEDCNGGWMARMDDKARPIVERLLSGETETELDDADRAALSAWAFKLSLVFDYVAASDVTHDPAVRSRFFHTHSVPDHAAVAFGVANASFSNSLYGVRTGYARLPGTGPTRVFSLLLKHLLVQVASSCFGVRLIPPVDLLPLRPGARMVSHPTSASEQEWPPAVSIESERDLVRVIEAVAPFPAET